MGVEGTLISRKFINLLIRHGLPAKAQLVLVDSLTGDILYPYDVSNYYGNVEMGFTDIDGELYFSNQSIPKEIPGNQDKVEFMGGDLGNIAAGVSIGTGQTYTFEIDETILNTYKDNTSTRTRAKKLFDPSDPNSGWRLDYIQLDVFNDPTGPPKVFHMNPYFVPTYSGVSKTDQSWTWKVFNFDSSTGRVDFQIMMDDNWAFPVNADYYDTGGGADPSSFLRFTWDVMLIDQVRNIPKSRARFGSFMGGLPKI